MNYIFDLDGTLVETTLLHAQTFVDAFSEIGMKVGRKEVVGLIGIPGIDIAKKLGAPDPLALYKRKVELFIERIGEVKEMKGATKTLKELKNLGHTICIATSSGKIMTNAILAKFNWPIDYLVTAEDVLKGKPNPEMLLKIKERFSDKAVMIGDTEYDREAAERAGIEVKILGDDLSKLEDLLL